jgi:alpha-beta hydrolase superfamily lysophospholipase
MYSIAIHTARVIFSDCAHPQDAAGAGDPSAIDPVGENLVGTRRLVDRYQALGLTRIETRYHTGARHELLNETNRDEVTADVLGWVGKTV